MKKLSDIPREAIHAYAKGHSCTPLHAFRDLYSQKLLDKIGEGDTESVLRELVYQVMGDGVKKVKGPATIIAPGGKA